MKGQRLTLAEAALELRLTYHQVRAMVLRGTLKGGRDELGRYYVEARAIPRRVQCSGRAGARRGR